MTDRDQGRDIPRIPAPNTLLLALDPDTGRLRLYSIDDATTVDVTHLETPPSSIDGRCLDWGQTSADGAGYLALGYREINPVTYALEGPSLTRDRLTLVRNGDGYQLRDTSTIPPKTIDLGTVDPGTEEADVIQIATTRADALGYHPIGYLPTEDGTWKLPETLPLSPQEALLALRSTDDEHVSSMTRRFAEMIAVLIAAVSINIAVVAIAGGIWWLAGIATMTTLGTILATQTRWRISYDWSCEICKANGVVFTARHRSRGEARWAKREHMRTAHGQRNSS